MTDKINPEYYQKGECTCGRKLQTYDYVKNLPYADATSIKYIIRHRDKGGSTDIKKAIWFRGSRALSFIPRVTISYIYTTHETKMFFIEF